VTDVSHSVGAYAAALQSGDGESSEDDDTTTSLAIRWLQQRLQPLQHGRRKRGYEGDLTPQLFMWGDIDMYIPLEKPDT